MEHAREFAKRRRADPRTSVELPPRKARLRRHRNLRKGLQKVPSRLLMIGDGPDRSRAEWLAVKKGIHDRVHFLGKQDRIHEKLGVADIMLMPSQLESFGLAALEAMACEVVPIATAVGGVPEVIDQDRTGFMAEVGDIDAMANYAIDLLIGRREVAARVRRRCRVNAQARFCARRRSSRSMRSFTARCWSGLVGALAAHLRPAASAALVAPWFRVPRWLSISIEPRRRRPPSAAPARLPCPIPVLSPSLDPPIPTPSSSTSMTSLLSTIRLRR